MATQRKSFESEVIDGYKRLMDERRKLYDRLFRDVPFAYSVECCAQVLADAVVKGNKILIFGNGGSAAEAQHFAAELVCRFKMDRRAIPAIALTTDTSILTAQANDNGFHSIFSRQIAAFVQEGDVVIALTTSDADHRHSENILGALYTAKEKGAINVGLFSEKTKTLLRFVDYSICVPASDTALIQEVHLSVIHFLCEMIELYLDYPREEL